MRRCDNILHCTPLNLLDFIRSAFSYISNDKFGQCNYSLPEEFLWKFRHSFNCTIRVAPILQATFHRMVDGFVKQRGHYHLHSVSIWRVLVLGIETKSIKLSKYVISTPLRNFFNLCVTQGTFSTYLKIAEVIPVFKKGDKQMASNYRPISILSQFDKIFEKMLCNRISDYLDKYKLLNQNQFGLRKHHSTTHAVSYIHEKLLQNVDKNCYSCCVFLDLSKAFDTVNHVILLYKLERHFGVRGKTLNLL